MHYMFYIRHCEYSHINIAKVKINWHQCSYYFNAKILLSIISSTLYDMTRQKLKKSCIFFYPKIVQRKLHMAYTNTYFD